MKPPLGLNLPSSVKANYDTMNALRALVIQASALALACGILVGIQRRKAALIVLWSFVVSGVAMSFVAILQKLSGSDKIIWIIIPLIQVLGVLLHIETKVLPFNFSGNNSWDFILFLCEKC